MTMLIGLRHSKGARDFRAPQERRAPMKVFFQGAGCRWIRGLLARNPCAIGIQPVHTRVDSCGLPQRATRRKATSPSLNSDHPGAHFRSDGPARGFHLTGNRSIEAAVTVSSGNAPLRLLHVVPTYL